MPVHVRRAKGGGYDIIETASGKKKGHSDTRRKAEISASKRNAAHRRKQRRKS